MTLSHRMFRVSMAVLAVSGLLSCSTSRGEEPAKKKKIVMVAGRPSHGPGEHEFNAGTQLLAKCLNEFPGVTTSVHLNGWPKEAHAFDDADCIFLFMDGGGGHPVVQDNRLAEIDGLMKKGVGLVCAHYAVEVPKDRGGPQLTDWIGGYYETNFSTNPHWSAELKELPKHPITSGVKPFTIVDEWYFNIRFPENSKIIPIVSATPPDDKRGTKDAKEHPGRKEVLAWALERPDGGRGFGFTGGHFHKNWANEDFRKLVLNAIVWSAKMDVPADGVPSKVSDEELKLNLDPKGAKKKP